MWWLGATKAAVRAALAVGRRRSRSRWTAAAPAGCCPTTSTRWRTVEPWAALLPVLDPTVMGWKERAFYLGRARAAPLRHQRQRRDDGLVGRPGGRLLGPGRGRAWSRCDRSRSCRRRRCAALDAEAARLTAWLDGVRVSTVYPSSAMKAPAPWVIAGDARAAQAGAAAGAAAAGPLRQARPAPVHQPPRLQPRLRAGGVPGPAADGLLLGVQPAPADLVRRRRADRVGQRGGVPRARAGRGGRARRRCTPRSTRRCPTGWTWSRWSRRRRSGSPTCWRPATGGSRCRCPSRRREAAVAAFLAADEVLVQRMTKKGLRDFDSRAAVLVAGRGPGRRRQPRWTWCCGTPSPRSGPTTCSRDSPRSSGSTLVGVPLLTRLAQGPLDPATGRDRRPAAPLRMTLRPPGPAVRYSPVVDDMSTRRRSRRTPGSPGRAAHWNLVDASPRRGPAGR